jgi:hypothetical protein
MCFIVLFDYASAHLLTKQREFLIEAFFIILFVYIVTVKEILLTSFKDSEFILGLPGKHA